MAEELKNKFDTTAKLIESSGGVFEVVVDGALIFSKKALNRFPESGEVADLISKK